MYKNHTYTASVVVRDSLLAKSETGKPWLIVEVTLDAVIPKRTNMVIFVEDMEGTTTRVDVTTR